ncbi:hypothetical protein JVU11DRAFT_3730 [Chiua virens]|nr:hypothetical protein JVU11DRAFT_3730 [Chiua virens]
MREIVGGEGCFRVMKKREQPTSLHANILATSRSVTSLYSCVHPSPLMHYRSCTPMLLDRSIAMGLTEMWASVGRSIPDVADGDLAGNDPDFLEFKLLSKQLPSESNPQASCHDQYTRAFCHEKCSNPVCVIDCLSRCAKGPSRCSTHGIGPESSTGEFRFTKANQLMNTATDVNTSVVETINLGCARVTKGFVQSSHYFLGLLVWFCAFDKGNHSRICYLSRYSLSLEDGMVMVIYEA